MKRKLHKHSGFALLEVMISALVLTVGAVAFMKLQATGLQYSYNDYARGQGTALTRDFVDQLRSNIGYITLSNTDKTGYILAGGVAKSKPPQEDTDCQSKVPEKGCAKAVLNFTRHMTSTKMAMITRDNRSILCYQEHNSSPGYIRVSYLWRDNSNDSSNTADFTGGADCPTKFDETIANESKRNNSVTIYAQL